VRSATLDGDVLSLHGDLNSTTPFEIITPAVASGKVTFNGQELAVERTSYGTLKTTSSLEANLPEISLPDLQSLTWVRIRICFTLVSADNFCSALPTACQRYRLNTLMQTGQLPTALPRSTPTSITLPLFSSLETTDTTPETSSTELTLRLQVKRQDSIRTFGEAWLSHSRSG